MLFIEILRQLVFVLLCIVMYDVIRSSPKLFGRKRKFTERAVHAIVCEKEGLGDSTGAVELCGEKPFFVIGHSVIRTKTRGSLHVTTAVPKRK